MCRVDVGHPTPSLRPLVVGSSRWNAVDCTWTPFGAMGEHWAHNAAHITDGIRKSCVSINKLGIGCCSLHPLQRRALAGAATRFVISTNASSQSLLKRRQ